MLATAGVGGDGQEWQWRRSDVWIIVHPSGVDLPAQGWKLHISATSRSAGDVLAAVVPILAAERVPFKFAANRKRVAALNASDTPRQAAGKFITIYPLNDAQAVRLAHACDEATRGFSGPTILSDRPLQTGSLVHYRYGAFAGGAVFNNDGELVEVIHDPAGRPVPDQRRAWFTPPPWAVDPFAPGTPPAAGDEPRPRVARPGTPVLLNGRYVVREALKHANKGGVYLAEDRAGGGTVVIKEARPHVEACWSGSDVADVLTHEARVLDLLAELGRTPRALDVFEQQGHLFLAVEYLEGQVFRDYVARRVEETGQALGAEELLATIRQLAEMMDAVHRAGVLLRDFTPNNLMVLPGGAFRLIDLELAHLLDEGPPPLSGTGTPGFSSPEQMNGRPSGFPDDYHALGAVVAYAATGMAPELVADTGPERSAGERLRDWIRGAEVDELVSTPVCDLVLGCMADEPSQRWGPQEVLAAIEQLRRGRCRHEAASVSRGQLAEAVAHIGRWLSRTVSPSYPHLWPTTGYGLRNDPCNLQYGASGPGLFLCEAARAGDDRGLRGLVWTASKWVSETVAAELERPPGLYFGLAGAVWFLIEAARCLEDPGLAEHSGTLALALPQATFNPDLTHGTSGIGLAQLHQWSLTGEARFLERAAIAARSVQAAAQPGAHGVVWPVARDIDSTFAGLTLYGFAHGNAGIAYFLLCAGAALGDQSCTDLGLEGLETLLRLAKVTDGSATWEAGEERSFAWAHWCNGASGVGTALIRGYMATGDERYRQMAEMAAKAVGKAKWRSPLVQCHGLAGNAEFLLDLHDVTGQGRFYDLAMELAATIYTRRFYDDGLMVFPNESGQLSASYNTGLAGIGSMFLRLLHGGPRPLMTDELLHPQQPEGGGR